MHLIPGRHFVYVNIVFIFNIYIIQLNKILDKDYGYKVLIKLSLAVEP